MEVGVLSAGAADAVTSPAAPPLPPSGWLSTSPAATPAPPDRPLAPIQAALLRMLDTADAIEAGRLPDHLVEPEEPAPVVATASFDDLPDRWPARIVHIAKVWTVVGVVGVIAFNLAPAPPRPTLAPAPAAPVTRVHGPLTPGRR